MVIQASGVQREKNTWWYAVFVSLLVVGGVFLGWYLYKESQSDSNEFEQNIVMGQQAMREELENMRTQLLAAPDTQSTDASTERLEAELDELQSQLTAVTTTLRWLQQQNTELRSRLLQAWWSNQERSNTDGEENWMYTESSVNHWSSDEHDVSSDNQAMVWTRSAENERWAWSNGVSWSTVGWSSTTFLPHGTSNPTNAQNSQRVWFEAVSTTIYSPTINGAYTSQGLQNDTWFPFPYGTTTNTNTAPQNTLNSQGWSTTRWSYQGTSNWNYGSHTSNGTQVV